MDDSKIVRRLKLLSIYAIVSSVIIILLILVSIKPFYYSNDYNLANMCVSSDSLHIPYLTAERVDIVEPDGNWL